MRGCVHFQAWIEALRNIINKRPNFINSTLKFGYIKKDGSAQIMSFLNKYWLKEDVVEDNIFSYPIR